MKRGTTIPDEQAKSLRFAHRQLLDKRACNATVIGIVAFLLEILEPWLDFHDLAAVKIQLAAIFIMTCTGGVLFLTRWGARHRLGLFTFGLLTAVAGFEAIVCRERAFETAYSDGFMVFFAFYCVLIPTSILHTGLVGMAMLTVTAVPEAIVTGDLGRLGIAAVGAVTGFAILLCGRHIANLSWEREFISAHLRSDFASTISHEFRSPLTSLCLLTEQLAEGRIADEADRALCYRLLVAESHGLRRLVERLLDFGEREARADDYEFENIYLAEFVMSVAREFERDDSSLGRRVEVQVGSNPPFVKADRAALRSVIWNLLENAAKYSPACDTVWADVDVEMEHAAIRIRDRGLGIPDAEQPHIFEKFVRGEAAKRYAIRGTGLGLAIVQLIVIAHRGKIQVASKLGEGSSFTVLLPAVNSA